MNDVEILEDIISEYKATAIEWKFGNVPVHLDERDIEAIENLIQRNKDLEQIEKEHKEENGRLRDRIKELEEENAIQRHQLNSAFDNGFIHKDLVREKIEELKNEYNIIYGLEKCVYKGTIEILEELLNNKTS